MTDELDVALPTWTLRLRLRATTGKDVHGYRLVVQRSDFYDQPFSRFNKSDDAYATLDIFLPTVADYVYPYTCLICIRDILDAEVTKQVIR